MSPRWSARFMCLRVTSAWLSGSLLCFAMIGCQSAAIRSVSHSPATNCDAPVRLVSDTATTDVQTKQPDGGHVRKIQHEAVARPPAAEPKTDGTLTQVSLEQSLWQNDEAAPLVTDQNRWCSECPRLDGAAVSGCPHLCLGCDLDNAMPMLWCDATGIVNWNNGLILAAAGGAAIAIRKGGADDDVRQWVADSPERWGSADQILGGIGDVKYQAPVMLGVYGYSLWTQDEELHDMMGSMLSASVITGVSTSVLKVIANTDRPSDHWMNGRYGFPSYHTASTFAIAAVLDEYYGCKVGLPAYLLAGAVGFSRIDEQDHDLSDVLFGSVLGFVIGKSVAGRHLCGNSEIQFGPYFHPTDGTPGIAFETKF